MKKSILKNIVIYGEINSEMHSDLFLKKIEWFTSLNRIKNLKIKIQIYFFLHWRLPSCERL